MKVYAQTINNPALDPAIRNLTGETFINRMISLFISWLLILGFIFFVVNFILGGIKWIQSQGDKAKIEEAQKQLTYAFVGLLIVFSIFAIIKVIGTTLGITGFENLIINLPRL